MSILSIDLAVKRYRDFGFAFLEEGSKSPEIIKPEQLGLEGHVLVLDLAASLHRFCKERGVSVLLIDGPHGWKDPNSDVRHMRIGERVLNTPGKTGIAGKVKPATYTNFTIFSTTLFQIFRQQYGWSLMTSRWASQKERRFIVEAFPTAAWRTLGLDPLPGKSRTKKSQLSKWRKELQRAAGFTLPKTMTHDELQAAVLLPIGEAILKKDSRALLLVGAEPSFTSAGDVVEGWIAVPVRHAC